MDRLDKMHLIRYDRKSLYLSSTELGRITSYYYVSVDTMEIFKREFHIDIETGDTFEDFKESKTDAYLRDIDILKILAQAKEFQQIKYRLEELGELKSIMNKYWAFDEKLEISTRKMYSSDTQFEEIIIEP